MPQESHPSAHSDHLQTGLAGDGSLRWVATDLTWSLEEARRRLDLSPLASIALGRALTGAVLLHRIALKTPSKLSVEVRGDGPLARVFAETNDEGHLRATLSEPHVQATSAGAEWDLAPVIGRGTLIVTRDDDRGTYSSRVELVSGELGDDLAHYLEQSEQIRSAILLGVLPKSTGIAAAGGLIVEALPGTELDVIRELEGNICMMDGVSKTLDRGGIQALIDGVFGDLERELLEHRPLEYRCRCDRDYLRARLQLLAPAEHDHLFESDAECEAICAFCGEQYVFTREELSKGAN